MMQFFVDRTFFQLMPKFGRVPLIYNGLKSTVFNRNRLNYSISHVFRQSNNVMNVFDRNTKRLQKDRAAKAADHNVYDYIKNEVAYRVMDRVYDIKRRFEVAVDLGCGKGHLAQYATDDVIGMLYNCDMSAESLKHVKSNVPSLSLVCDEEYLPFQRNSFDLIVSSLSLHWVNDLPGTFKQIHSCLRNDGVFLAAMFGGDTLFELRCSLQLAEIEREGGFAAHISPFTSVQDIGALLNRAGFTMLTLDLDEIKIQYPSMLEVMTDLKGMGESNASWNRKLHLRRDTILAAANIYKEMYGNEDGSVPATFEIIYMIGWKPDPTQPQPAERGSGVVSLKDLAKLGKVIDADTDATSKPIS
ncbi:NADH dehydrogenase [ubiquinone] 1 alpha subcomplex assembly factor 5 [Chamberlinius hualienensis]